MLSEAGDERNRTHQWCASSGGRLIGIIDRKEFCSVLGDAAAVVSDVARDDAQIGLSLVDLICDGLLPSAIAPSIEKHSNPTRLMGCLWGSPSRSENLPSLLENSILKIRSRLKPRQLSLVDPV